MFKGNLGGLWSRKLAWLAILPTGIAVWTMSGSDQYIVRESQAVAVTPRPDWSHGALLLKAGSVGTNLRIPAGLSFDAFGSLYVADSSNRVIRRISSTGVVATVAGSGREGFVDGPSGVASFGQPSALAVDVHGNLFVADTHNHSVRKISPDGVVRTLAGSGKAGHADGSGAAASFDSPRGVAFDQDGGLLVADTGNNLIRKVTPEGWVSTLVNGATKAARFSDPTDIAVDQAGNIFVADSGNNAVRKIAASGAVTTLAGSGVVGDIDGSGQHARFDHPSSVAVDHDGSLFVAEFRRGRIRRVTQSGEVTTYATRRLGSVGKSSDFGEFEGPLGLAVDRSGSLFVSTNAGVIRKFSSNLAGEPFVGHDQSGLVDGSGAVARFKLPGSMAADKLGNLYIAEPYNHAVRKLSPSGVVTTLAGTGTPGDADGPQGTATLNRPEGVAVDDQGNVYVADSANHLIRKISANGIVTTLAGTRHSFTGNAEVDRIVDGEGTAARFRFPRGIAVDAHGDIYIGEQNLIRKVTPSGTVTTIAGGVSFFGYGYRDGPARVAVFHDVGGLAVDGNGNVFVADIGNRAIRRLGRDGQVTTLAGGKRSFESKRDKGVIAGGLVSGAFADGQGAQAEFGAPIALAVDNQGNVFVADGLNRAIRKVTADGVVSTLLGPARGQEATIGPLPASIGRPNGIAVLPNGQLAITVDNAVLVTEGVRF